MARGHEDGRRRSRRTPSGRDPDGGQIPAVRNGNRRKKGRDGSNYDVNMAMDLTRRIKACREWREVQALFEAEVQRYNQIHVSATVVAMRR